MCAFGVWRRIHPAQYEPAASAPPGPRPPTGAVGAGGEVIGGAVAAGAFVVGDLRAANAWFPRVVDVARARVVVEPA
jgi:hypothetical protein